MTQESKHSQSSSNLEIKQEKKSNNTITKKSNLELELKNEVDTIENMLMRGVTLSEILEDKKLSVSQTYISRTNITTNSNITNFIKGLAESGSDINNIIDKIASKYTIQELNQAIKDNDNPYFVSRLFRLRTKRT